MRGKIFLKVSRIDLFHEELPNYGRFSMARGTHIMLKKMPIMFMLSAPDFAYYAQSFSLLC